MPQKATEVSKLLEQVLMLPFEDQLALVDSLVSSLKGKVDEEVLTAWEGEIARRVRELDSGQARTVPWSEVRERNLKKLRDAR